MRHKYLTAVRHPRRRFSLTLHLILSPRPRGLMNFFFNHRHRRKLTSSPVRRAASTTRSPLDSPREYASNLANACAVNTWTRIHYTCTLQRKEKKERRRETREAKFVEPWPFFVERWSSFNERPNREPPHIPR